MVSTLDDTPTYNLKAVVRETGLKADTVRAWERRYGVPQPARTAGRHRLYSQRDIATLKWLVARQKEGLSISRAVRLWQQTLESGQDPFLVMPIPTSKARKSEVVAGEEIEKARQAWIQACLSFDEQTAEQTLAQAAALYPIETLIGQVLAPGMHDIGEGWHNNQISASQEHFATALAERRLHALLAAAPSPTREQRLLVGCPQGEQHALAALMLSLLLRRRGWEVVYLGADTPPKDLEQTLAHVRPHLVVMSVQRLATTPVLNEVAALLAPYHATLAYGGSIFVREPQLKDQINGIYLGDEFDQAVETIQTWFERPRPVKTAATSSLNATLALQDFRTHWPAMLAQLQTKPNLPPPLDTPARAAKMFGYLAADIEAALSLNDINLAAANLSWMLHYMRQRNMPLHSLAALVDAMRQAAEQHLSPSTTLVSDWLARITAQYTPR